MKESLALCHLPSPLGTILLVADGRERLLALDFQTHEDRMRRLLELHHGARRLVRGPAPRAVSQQLAAYFDGDPSALDALRVELGGTSFQRQVWSTLRHIPAGGTTSYIELARHLGRPGAARAVGRANGANPVAIVIPCHRVIGADGSLTGYAGGLSRKRWLLSHERSSVAQSVSVVMSPN